MKSHINISALFPKHLFWDVDIKKLDIQKDSEVIIPRALYMTTSESLPQDIARLEELYSSTEILEALKHTKEKISNNVCKMVAERYFTPVFSRFKHKAY
ncbi:MAG: hypothetical protein EOO13_16590 [Chitinophagaceae bacterium]|nr:MAG: hypothetical protein EOO13_16590 [Chitinophagaceae bacterium]